MDRFLKSVATAMLAGKLLREAVAWRSIEPEWHKVTGFQSMRFLNNGEVPFLQFDIFPGESQVRHAVFTRLGGVSEPPYKSLNLSVSVPDDRKKVFVNRERAYGTHGRTNEQLVHAYLTHGADVARVTQRDYGRYVGPVDAIITDEPGCGLTMNYADCTPILIYDPQHHAIGLGHAGWKGAVKDLPGAIVRAMRDAFGSDPSQLLAAIGPSIGGCCYEIGEEVIGAVRDSFEESALLLRASDKSDRAYFKLPQANATRLLEAGVEDVEVAPECTACRTDLFFSHRAENGRTGRFGALLLLE